MQLRFGVRYARLTLQVNQLGGFYRQRCITGTKSLGDDFLRLVQVLARMHQIGGGLHGFGAANRLENGHHRIGMRQNVFAGIHYFAANQRLGKSARTHQSVRLLRQAVGGGRDNRTGRVLGRCRGWRFGHFIFHRVSSLSVTLKSALNQAGILPRQPSGLLQSASGHAPRLQTE